MCVCHFSCVTLLQCSAAAASPVSEMPTLTVVFTNARGPRYNLNAFALNADLARNGGTVDLWGHKGPVGQSIRGVIDWLLPYVTPHMSTISAVHAIITISAVHAIIILS